MSYKITLKHSLMYLILILPTYSYASSVDANPTNELGLFQQGVQLSADGKWLNAEKIFRGIAERNPSWPEPKNNLAIALYKSGKIEQSQKAFEDAVTSLPSFKVAQINRQRLYNYSATLAYNKATGTTKKTAMPTLEILNDVKSISNIIKKSNGEDTKNNVAQNNIAFKQIKDSLLQWSKSWSKSDVKQYLSAYSNNFVPQSNNKDYTQWSKQRREKLNNGKIDNISLNSIQVFINNNKKHALAEFIQDYKARNYQDKVLKQIHLAYENNRWLIVSEKVLKEIK